MRSLIEVDNQTNTNIGAFIIWLFHVSAIIGVSVGFFDWFIPKTPLNLIIGGLVLCYLFPINTIKSWSCFLLCIAVGIFSEWLGVQHGLIFGEYNYGSNLGPKIDGVPWLIGVNWAVLIIITANMAQHWISTKWMRPIVGSLLMLFLDYFMEGVAPTFDFWTFDGGVAPLQNYIGWFAVALLLQIVYLILKVGGNYRISMHLYFCQLVFFIYFYVFYNL